MARGVGERLDLPRRGVSDPGAAATRWALPHPTDAMPDALTQTDLRHLRRCVDLAEDALGAGDEPFGSLLVGPDGDVLAEALNRAVTGDPTQHPELELAQWAAATLSAEVRAAATVYTSGEHCPMCSAAHAWAGLARIVYASSSEQLGAWLSEFGAAAPPVRSLPVQEVAPGVAVAGPDEELAARVRDLHRRFHAADDASPG